MQFKLELIKESASRFLPLNYRHSFSSSMSLFLLNDALYPQAGGSRSAEDHLQPFTFGQMTFDSFFIHQQEESIEHHGGEASLEVRVLIEGQEDDLITDQLLNQRFKLGGVQYQIVKVTSMPVIEFQDVMVYRCICPISIKNSRRSQDETYLSPKDHGFHQSFKVNLMERLIRAHPEVGELKRLERFCPEFQFELLNEPEKKGFSGETFTDDSEDVIGYQFDFKLKASPILHEFGFYEGFGLQHSMGWGFVDVIA